MTFAKTCVAIGAPPAGVHEHTLAYDGSGLVAAAAGPYVHLVDVASVQHVTTLGTPESSVGNVPLTAIAWCPARGSPPVRRLAAGDAGGNLFVWDIASHKLVQNICAPHEDAGSAVVSLAWLRDAHLLAQHANGALTCFDVDAPAGSASWRWSDAKHGVVSRVAFSATWMKIASITSQDKVIVVRVSADGPGPVHVIMSGTNAVDARLCDAHPNAVLVLTSTDVRLVDSDLKICLWKAVLGPCRFTSHSIIGFRGGSASPLTLTTSTPDHTVLLWTMKRVDDDDPVFEITSASDFRTSSTPFGNVHSMCRLDPDDLNFWTRSNDGTMAAWTFTPKNNKWMATSLLDTTSTTASHVLYEHALRRVHVLSSDGCLFVFDAVTSQCLRRVDVLSPQHTVVGFHILPSVHAENQSEVIVCGTRAMNAASWRNVCVLTECGYFHAVPLRIPPQGRDGEAHTLVQTSVVACGETTRQLLLQFNSGTFELWCITSRRLIRRFQQSGIVAALASVEGALTAGGTCITFFHSNNTYFQRTVTQTGLSQHGDPRVCSAPMNNACCAWYRDGEGTLHAVLCDASGNVALLDMLSGRRLVVIRGQGTAPKKLCASGCGKVAVVYCDQAVATWCLMNRRALGLSASACCTDADWGVGEDLIVLTLSGGVHVCHDSLRQTGDVDPRCYSPIASPYRLNSMTYTWLLCELFGVDDVKGCCLSPAQTSELRHLVAFSPRRPQQIGGDECLRLAASSKYIGSDDLALLWRCTSISLSDNSTTESNSIADVLTYSAAASCCTPRAVMDAYRRTLASEMRRANIPLTSPSVIAYALLCEDSDEACQRAISALLGASASNVHSNITNSLVAVALAGGRTQDPSPVLRETLTTVAHALMNNMGTVALAMALLSNASMRVEACQIFFERYGKLHWRDALGWATFLGVAGEARKDMLARWDSVRGLSWAAVLAEHAMYDEAVAELTENDPLVAWLLRRCVHPDRDGDGDAALTSLESQVIDRLKSAGVSNSSTE